MTRNGRVSLPDVTTDRPRPLGAAAVAFGALVAGLASAYGLHDGCAHAPQASVEQPPAPRVATTTQRNAAAERAQLSARAAGSPAQQPRATVPERPPAARATAAAIEPAAQRAAAARSEPIASVRTEPPQPPAVPAADAPQPAPSASAAAPRFDRGYVAYLRCDGVAQREGPFPCPRDLALERRVWKILSELEHCPLAQEKSGAADIRIEITRASGHAEWLVASGALDRDTVSRCVGSVLSSVATSLRPTRMIVSFRFELH